MTGICKDCKEKHYLIAKGLCSLCYHKIYKRKETIREIDNWFKGRGSMEKWEWEKIKKKLDVNEQVR